MGKQPTEKKKTDVKKVEKTTNNEEEKNRYKKAGAEYKFNNPSSRLVKLHIFPFGGMKKTSQWMNSILDNPLKIKNNNEFEIKLA